MYGRPVKDDLSDLDEEGRARVLSVPISKTVGFRLDSLPAFLAAGIAMVGAAMSGCIIFRRKSSCEGLDLGIGLPKVSLAPVEPCLGRKPEVGIVLSSERSEESSYPLIILSQGLQTRIVPVWPNEAPDRIVVHLASNI